MDNNYTVLPIVGHSMGIHKAWTDGGRIKGIQQWMGSSC